MDIFGFYGQQGQLESLQMAHRMLESADCLGKLDEAIAREKLARLADGTALSSCFDGENAEVDRMGRKRTEFEVLGLADCEMGSNSGMDGCGSTTTCSPNTSAGVLEGNAKSRADGFALWRRNFNSYIWRHYKSKSWHRSVFSRHTVEHILCRLKSTASCTSANISVANQRLSERYKIDLHEDREALFQRGTSRVFVAIEDMFEALQRLHVEMGHSRNRMQLYAAARARFANVGKEIMREYIDGYEQCLLGTGNQKIREILDQSAKKGRERD